MSLKWPGSKKCAVCISFDVDADISWRQILRRNNIERDEPVVLSQGIYEIKRGIGRVLSILRKHGIKATFFIPGVVAEKYRDTLMGILRDGHEIAHHGHNHIVPSRLTPEMEEEEFKRGIEALERAFGVRPAGYRSPGEGLGEKTHELIAKNKMVYDSSMMDDDLPYIIKTPAGRIVELPFRWVMDDWVYFGFNYFPPLEYRRTGPESPRTALQVWIDELDVICSESLYLMFIGHPQQIGQPSRAKALDEFLTYITRNRQDVWVATAEEIATYILTQQ
ncbi:MAG: polysaccharide deacetylase [Desulfurococcaceae archaeon]